MNGNTTFLVVGASTLVAGLCLGIGTGILIAPHSGARTRRYLKSFADNMVEDTAEAVDKVIERGRRLMAV